MLFLKENKNKRNFFIVCVEFFFFFEKGVHGNFDCIIKGIQIFKTAMPIDLRKMNDKNLQNIFKIKIMIFFHLNNNHETLNF